MCLLLQHDKYYEIEKQNGMIKIVVYVNIKLKKRKCVFIGNEKKRANAPEGKIRFQCSKRDFGLMSTVLSFLQILQSIVSNYSQAFLASFNLKANEFPNSSCQYCIFYTILLFLKQTFKLKICDF